MANTPQKNTPADLRTTTNSLQNLTSESYWLDQDGNSVAYAGMSVAVVDTDSTKNGIYYLTALPATEENNWTKAGDDAIANTNAFDDYFTKTEIADELLKESTRISDGTTDNIVSYSDKAGEFGELARIDVINSDSSNRSAKAIPSEVAAAEYTDNHKPMIVTQGNGDLDVTSSQLTFWLEV